MPHKVFRDCDNNIIDHHDEPLEWRVSVYALTINPQNQLLILKNKTEKFYDVPGGGVDLGESLEIALQRECLEEAGLTIDLQNLTHIYHTTDFFYHREQKQFYQTLQIFYKTKPIGELTAPTESSTELVKWVAWSDLKHYPLPTAATAAVEVLLAAT